MSTFLPILGVVLVLYFLFALYQNVAIVLPKVMRFGSVIRKILNLFVLELKEDTLFVQCIITIE